MSPLVSETYSHIDDCRTLQPVTRFSVERVGWLRMHRHTGRATVGMDDDLRLAARGIDCLSRVIRHIYGDVRRAHDELERIRTGHAHLPAVTRSQWIDLREIRWRTNNCEQQQQGSRCHVQNDCGRRVIRRPLAIACCVDSRQRDATSSSATMLMILISGFTAGPAVSL